MKVEADQARELEERARTNRELLDRIAFAFEAVRSWPGEQGKAGHKPFQVRFLQWGQLWVEAARVLTECHQLSERRLKP